MDPRPPLRPFEPFSREERHEARRFAERMQLPAPALNGVLLLMTIGYGIMLVAGWPFTWIVPPGGSAGLTVLVGEGMGWLDRELLLGGEPWRLVSPWFLHGSLFHLVGNSVVLFAVGRVAENLYGRGPFLLIFVVGGLSASVASATFGHGAPSLGASGAVMAVVGMLVAAGLVRRERLPRLVEDFFRVNMWFFLILIFGLGWVLKDLVDNWGHGGGVVAGFAVGLFLRPLPESEQGQWLGTSVWRWPRWSVAFSAILMVGFVWVVVGAVDLRRGGMVETLNQAWRDVRGGAYSAALEGIDQVLEQRPGDVHLHHDRAEVAGVAEQWAVAVESQRIVTEAAARWDRWNRDEGRAGPAPRMPPAKPAQGYNNLSGYLLMSHPDDDRAIREALELAELACDRGQTRLGGCSGVEHIPEPYLNTRAYARLLAGDPQGALEDAELALAAPDRAPENDVYLKVLALADLGREEEALRFFDAVVQRYPQGMLVEEARARLMGVQPDPNRPREHPPPEVDWLGP
jgi:membrane associated rhomboid family serine protease